MYDGEGGGGGGLEDLFKALMRGFSSFMQAGKERVERRIPMAPEWSSLESDYRVACKMALEACRKAKSLHRQLWARIESDTQEYKRMRITDDSKFIEVYKEDIDVDLEGPQTRGPSPDDIKL